MSLHIIEEVHYQKSETLKKSKQIIAVNLLRCFVRSAIAKNLKFFRTSMVKLFLTLPPSLEGRVNQVRESHANPPCSLSKFTTDYLFQFLNDNEVYKSSSGKREAGKPSRVHAQDY
jgi:hypothetical protein